MAIEEIGEESGGKFFDDSPEPRTDFCIAGTVGGNREVEILFNFFSSARASSCSNASLQGFSGPSFGNRPLKPRRSCQDFLYIPFEKLF
jgi:hypothetical protein